MTAKNLEQQLEEAQLEASDARARAEELEQSVIRGDSKISIADIEAAESKARYAELRAASIGNQIVQAEATARRAAFKRVRKEIDETTDNTLERLAELLRTIDEASDKFLEVAKARTEQIQQWRAVLRENGAEPMKPNQKTPPAEQEGLAPSDRSGSIRIDDVTVRAPGDVRWLLEQAIKPSAPRTNPQRPVSQTQRDIYAQLRHTLTQQ